MMDTWRKFWLLLTIVTPTALAGVQSMEVVRQAISRYLVSNLQRQYRDFDVRVASLDSRLQLPECSNALSVTTLRDQVPVGDLALRVRCQGEHPWTIYARAHVSLFKRVLVTNRPLAKGTPLTSTMVALKRRDIATLRQGYIERPELVVGRYLKRSLPAGHVLTPALLAAAKVIRKGEAVVIRAQARGLDVRMGGHALMDGEQGQRIRVINDRSRRVVEAIVHGPGEVHVFF